MKDASLFQIAFPCCRSQLTEKLVSSLEVGSNFDEFHSVVLEIFLPGRMKGCLCQETFYRLQNHRKPLASFIANIKWVARVLRVGLSESAVVGTILKESRLRSGQEWFLPPGRTPMLNFIKSA